MQTLPFIKMHGLGNDYVYIDCFQPETAAMIADADLALLAQRVSDRHRGIGSDGLVLMLPSKKADAQMRMFNADGTEAQMCGNAIRCVAKYLYENGICKQTKMRIETLAGIRELELYVREEKVEQIKVNMGCPISAEVMLTLCCSKLPFISVNLGNPHAVFFRQETITSDELMTLGKKIGTHPHFPEGTNVEFVRVINAKELEMRVWERGTGETLACGTGACASAVAAIQQGLTERAVTVHLRGGDLFIQWPTDDSPVYMTGSATIICKGEYIFD